MSFVAALGPHGSVTNKYCDFISISLHNRQLLSKPSLTSSAQLSDYPHWRRPQTILPLPQTHTIMALNLSTTATPRSAVSTSTYSCPRITQTHLQPHLQAA